MVDRDAGGPAVVDDPAGVPGQFGELIRQARASHGQRAVVLVDEYDKPILDNITDGAIARQMRDGLRDLYSVIKGRPMPTSTARVASRST